MRFDETINSRLYLIFNINKKKVFLFFCKNTKRYIFFIKGNIVFFFFCIFLKNKKIKVTKKA